MSSLGIGFALGWIGSMPVAGAVSVFVFQRGLAGRVRAGLFLSAGAAIAEVLWCAVARFGAAQLIDRWPVAGSVAKVAGGLILIGLGIYFLRLKRRLPAGGTDDSVSSSAREFGLGFTLVAGNISIPINWLALLAVVYSLGLDPFTGPPGFFSLGLALGIMGWFTALLLLLDRFRSRFTDATLSWIMQGMGALILLTGVVALIRS